MICGTCGKDKDVSMFYESNRWKCKECVKAGVSANYAARREQYAEYERKRFMDRDRRAKAVEYQRRRRALNREKYVANSAVGSAIRDGRIVRLPCEVCGSLKSEAHIHDDYSRPLDVRWLCRKHHLEIHGKVAYE